ncbi:hypothetical protein D3C76_1003940 [compost metagenome]
MDFGPRDVHELYRYVFDSWPCSLGGMGLLDCGFQQWLQFDAQLHRGRVLRLQAVDDQAKLE